MHPRAVVWLLGSLLLLYAAAMLVPDVVAFVAHDGTEGVFTLSAALCAGIGWLLRRLGERPPAALTPRDGFLIVAGAWLVLTLMGALPFWLARLAGPLDAWFESASGLTTTGATVLVGLDHMPPAILFWRSLQEWLGGMGVVILAVAIMPMLGVGGMQLFRAEAPGPVKDKLAARVTETARVLWELYLGLTIACALLYGWFGMDGFDAINHAMTTVAIGGFSTHDASFAYFHSTALEIVAIVFMFVAGINFTLHFAALRMRTLRVYGQDDEFRAYVFWLVFAIAQLAVVVYILGDGDDPIALVFNAVSIATTTGFATSDYELWPQAAVVVMMASMYVGACAGSTGGGMKVARFLLLLRQGVREIKRLIHPHGVVSVKIGGRPVDYEVRSAVWGFFSLYVASAIAITAILAATGLDLVTAASAASACLTNTGPGFGLVGPTDNYAALPDLAKGVLIFAMILGRLELYTFFVLISPAFWRE